MDKETAPRSCALVGDEAGTARCYSFAKLADRFRRASGFLHKAGIRCGDRVLVMQPRVPAWWIVMPDFGAALARARETVLR
jgi:acyl-coenzyme A synthetase/AMP-(fatty) acid ligase